MTLYGFMDEEKQDPKTWALANAIKKKKKKDLMDVDIDDMDLLDDDETDIYLTEMLWYLDASFD